MDFKTIQEYYPMKKTLVGFYSSDQTFQAHCLKDVIDIDRWDFAPLDWATNYFPFIHYDKEDDIFRCWCFAAWPVEGYYTDNPYGEDYKLITKSEDFGIEIVDPFDIDEFHIIFSPDPQDEIEEKIIEFYKDDNYRATLELLAYRWYPDAYISGYIMTTYDAVKIFCKDMET